MLEMCKKCVKKDVCKYQGNVGRILQTIDGIGREEVFRIELSCVAFKDMHSTMR